MIYLHPHAAALWAIKGNSEHHNLQRRELWARVPPQERAAVLHNLGELVKSSGDIVCMAQDACDRAQAAIDAEGMTPPPEHQDISYTADMVLTVAGGQIHLPQTAAELEAEAAAAIAALDLDTIVF